MAAAVDATAGYSATPDRPTSREAPERRRRGTHDRPGDQIEHDDRLPAMRALKPSEREGLYLKGLGYSYQEIMRLTGDALRSAAT
jgi:hypothetical protein